MWRLKIQRHSSRTTKADVLSIPALPADLRPLERALVDTGVEIRFALPPRRGVYGLYQSGERRIWISPVTRDLGILRHTFLHEAVHAVQSCRTGRAAPLGIKTPLTPVVQRKINQLLYSSYSHGASAVEKEAFEIQSRQDAVPLLLDQLKKRC